MERKTSEIVALQALAWLVKNDELRGTFMGSTGLAPEDLRNAGRTPELLVAVLDFLVLDDAWVVAFCEDAGLKNEDLMLARAGLPGGEPIHWT